MNFKKKFEKYWRVNLLGPGPRLMKKRIYLAAVSQNKKKKNKKKNRVISALHKETT